jgi:hypothetical protein
MIRLIDRSYRFVARILIISAGFLGISRKQLTIGWIVWAGVIAFLFRLTPRVIFINMIMAILFGIPKMIDWMESTVQKLESGSTRPYVDIVDNMTIRVGGLLFIQALCIGGIFCVGKNDLPNSLLAVPKFLFPTMLWTYFLADNGTKSRYRLKDIAKVVSKRLKAKLSPPVPQPVQQ